jgi:Zn-dependent protease with chaperone function
MTFLSLYSPNPNNVPGNLSALTSSYKVRAGLAVFSVLLFFILYFSMIVFFGYLVQLAFFYPVYQINNLTGMLVIKIGMILGTVALFIFSLKFLFKIKNNKPKNRILLKKDEFPQIFDYIQQICKDTGAPTPGKIFIDTEINAYVSYSNVWQSLFLPVKKNLTIGAGLLHVLNLSEFKAVMAHEFGHFAQRSMRIGSYIHSANIIIHDLIFTRDGFDEALEKWRRTDIRFSVAAWLISPVIWVIRKLLYLFYLLLNILHSSLSREMEFNADKVAVRLTGSIPIISALWKLEHASKSWNETLSVAYSAAQLGKKTKNLYKHYWRLYDECSSERESFIRNLNRNEKGQQTFFNGEEFSIVNMYSSHPPHKQREESAKFPFVDCVIDNRSSEIILGNNEFILEQLTELMYAVNHNIIGKCETVSDSEFDNYIKNELINKELFQNFDNTFEQRFLQIPEKESRIDFYLYEQGKFENIESELKSELAKLNEQLLVFDNKLKQIQQWSEGLLKLPFFEHNGKKFEKSQMQQAYEFVLQEKNNYLMNEYKSWDIKFISLYYSASKITGDFSNLNCMYEQHIRLVTFYKSFLDVKNSILVKFQKLRGRDEVLIKEIHDFAGFTNDKMMMLEAEMNELMDHELTPLSNIETKEDLKSAILGIRKFPKSSRNIFETGDFDKLVEFIETVVGHLYRIDLKSVGTILRKHEEIKKQLPIKIIY